MDKYFFLLLTIGLCACGPQVSISNKKLAYNSSLKESFTPDQSGTLKRGKPDRLLLNGTEFPVSMYSSYQSLEFIAAKPLTTEMEIRFKGKLNNNEWVLEKIEVK